ncbi:MAG: ABC transporter permease [Cyclobacteriaceae bacterium]
MKKAAITNPPKWPLSVLKIFIKKDYLEEIQGDMQEVFEDDLEVFTLKKARRKYVWETVKLLRPVLTKKLEGTQKLNNYGMIKNNLRIAFRSLIKQKEYSAINIFGLTVSMAVSMIIILFLIDQDQMDEHNPDADRIYRVLTEYDDEVKERVVASATSPFELRQLLEFNVDQVEETSQLVKGAGNVKFGEDVFSYGGLYVSPNFLKFFDFELEKGDKKNALQNVNSVVLSAELAKKLFRNQEPIGQLVEIDQHGSFSVTGIIDKTLVRSHLDFDLLIHEEMFSSVSSNEILLTNWEASSKNFYNYIKLKEGYSKKPLLSFLKTMDSKFPEEKQALYDFNVQLLSDINLGRLVGNEIGITSPNFVLYFFIVLAAVLMLSSSFNYMNLSIARGLKRAKEVGVRKVIGAGKRQIIVQFLVEAQLVMFCSLVAAFLLLQILVPIFNDLKILRDIDGAITMNFNSNLSVYFVFLSFSVAVGLVAGLYPAIYLSSFKSLKVLKGTTNAGKSPSFLFRKILVFCQYAFSVVFIITSIILYQQANLYANVDYGFTNKNMINVPISKKIPYESFRNELLKRSEIEGVSAVSSLLIVSSFEEVLLVNKNVSEDEVKSATLSIDPYTVENLDLKLLAGRNFLTTAVSDQKNSFIINEKALAALGYTDADQALNQSIDVIKVHDTGRKIAEGKIIGVVRDFNYQFVFLESGPLVMNYDPAILSSMNIKTGEISSAYAAEIIEEVWKEFDDVHPFEYETYAYSIADIDDEFGELVHIIGLVAFIAIIIACLGQFSMVVHHVQLKVKEIGIRKVLGSNLGSLMFMLSKDFMIVILAAVLVATPLAWKINDLWTSKVYLSPDVSFFNMSLGVGIILLTAFLTIFFLVRRAVNANPVESLKYE